ncbi:hypothetical protein BQ8794_40165 [Mesorhizobium prunaredense]|uniref:Uncharacterized protein n=1 Tax=Mesorhizobium prunaredense TaxID=1631249 RepID=A0A1R3VCF3_9HYPH|nr:hypothetical protein BQ8794_40165 [Mesorhizobium prunaredense]
MSSLGDIHPAEGPLHWRFIPSRPRKPSFRTGLNVAVQHASLERLLLALPVHSGNEKFEGWPLTSTERLVAGKPH